VLGCEVVPELASVVLRPEQASAAKGANAKANINIPANIGIGLTFICILLKEQNLTVLFLSMGGECDMKVSIKTL
jgi:hypothetical protein